MHNALSVLLAAGGALLLQVAAPAAAQTVLYEKSRITCVSRQENVPVEAQFKKFAAQIAFDRTKPETGKVQIEIDVSSFDIGYEEEHTSLHRSPGVHRLWRLCAGLSGLGDLRAR